LSNINDFSRRRSRSIFAFFGGGFAIVDAGRPVRAVIQIEHFKAASLSTMDSSSWPARFCRHLSFVQGGHHA